MQNIDHYENFPVASWLCPPQLRPAVLALYRFARTADDLADEGPASADERRAALLHFRADLTASLADGAQHISAKWPQIFGPLGRFAAQYQLPPVLLHDLLDAFEQDVAYTEAGRGYACRAELLDYCRRSANPVGRLLLHMCGVDDDISLTQSDAICTALQLINFWQDRSQDLARGRDYLPQHHSLAEELQFARDLLCKGAPLVHRVAGRFGWELRLVVQGGLRVLDKLPAIHLQDYPDQRYLPRPRLNRKDMVTVLWRAVCMS